MGGALFDSGESASLKFYVMAGSKRGPGRPPTIAGRLVRFQTQILQHEKRRLRAEARLAGETVYQRLQAHLDAYLESLQPPLREAVEMYAAAADRGAAGEET